MSQNYRLYPKTWLMVIILAGVVINLLLISKFTTPSQKLDLFIYDSFLKYVPLKQGAAVEEKFIVLGIDEKTEDRFPEPMILWQEYYGTVIRKLADAGVKAIAFDMVFSSALSDSNLKLEKIKKEFIGALQYAQEKGIPVFSGYLLNGGKREAIPLVYRQAFGRHIGYLNYSCLNDTDGKIRRFAIRNNADFSMIFKLLRTDPALDRTKIAALGRLTDVYIDYRIPGNPPLYSFCDIYQDPLDTGTKTLFKDKYVLIGHTAPDSKDLAVIPAPVGYQGQIVQKLPGVIINYFIGKTLLAENIFVESELSRSKIARIILVLIISVVIPMMVFQTRMKDHRKRSLWIPACLIIGVITVLLFVWAVLLMFYNFKVFYAADFILAFIITGMLSIAFRMFLIHQEKRAILKEFGSFVSDEVVDQLLYDENKRKKLKKGVLKKITIMFVDIREFTKMCNIYECKTDVKDGTDKNSHLEDTGVHLFVKDLNDYFVTMTRIIKNNNGFLNRIVGDGLLVLFGAFGREKEQADDAVRCAMDMLEEITVLNKEKMLFNQVAPLADGTRRLEIGIGINTGQAIIACSGSEEKKELTVIGSAANKASRIENLTKTEASSLILGCATEDILSGENKAKLDLEKRIIPELKGFAPNQQVFAAKKYNTHGLT